MIEARRVHDGAAAGAHRRRGRSAGLVAASAPTPAASSRPGIDGDGIGYVLADATVSAAPAGTNGRRGGRALSRASRPTALVAEVNQGGDMVRAVIREVDPAVPVTPVRATRGKYLRAEPVALLYAAGPRAPCRRLSGARGRDVRLRPRRALVRPLARPARRAGLGDDRADARRRRRRTAGAGSVANSGHSRASGSRSRDEVSATDEGSIAASRGSLARSESCAHRRSQQRDLHAQSPSRLRGASPRRNASARAPGRCSRCMRRAAASGRRATMRRSPARAMSATRSCIAACG